MDIIVKAVLIKGVDKFIGLAYSWIASYYLHPFFELKGFITYEFFIKKRDYNIFKASNFPNYQSYRWTPIITILSFVIITIDSVGEIEHISRHYQQFFISLVHSNCKTGGGSPL